LSGAWGITDYTNALKSGFDLSRKCWPSWLSEKLPLKQEWLPGVVPSGTPVGNLSASLCAALGLPAAVKVVAGMTDGCASQVASGAVKPGDWNTTIGTTLVIKGVTRNELTDPEGRFYSHRHPDGLWMPGGASNTGADWIAGEFSDDLAALNEQARSLIPTGHLVYPLQQQGERFPFIAPDARGFHPSGLSRGERFAASMEGVAYIERYAYELVQSLSSEKVKCVFTAGGGSNSDTWLIIRSNVMNLPVYKMRNVSGAIGAAIIAAAQTHFNTLSSAATAMTQIEKKFLPDRRLAQQYETSYRRFVELLSQKGYINKMQSHA
jgi:sugar (pentulose or hexulose) kinase